MEYGMCKLSVIPVRAEADDRSEIVSQLLFGESFDIIDVRRNWWHINCHHDHYEGWIDKKQASIIQADFLKACQSEKARYQNQAGAYIAMDQGQIHLAIGSRLPLYNDGTCYIGQQAYHIQQPSISSSLSPRERIKNTALQLLHSPYLWGGRTQWGIDCSGFTQLAYRMAGIAIRRDASQQALQGELLSFPEEAQIGDLAFFDNDEEKITHVGIILENQKIIHASGCIRIDLLDNEGIFHSEKEIHTHRLRLIRSFI